MRSPLESNLTNGQEKRKKAELKLVKEESPAFLQFQGLIESGSDAVTPLALKQALTNEEITPSEHTELLEQTLDREQYSLSEVSDTAKGLQTKIEKMEIDPVTKAIVVANLQPYLEELWQKLNNGVKRESDPNIVMVIFIDLDNLRKWNGESHKRGDKALLKLSDGIRKEIKRNNGVLFRRGGGSDELIAVLSIVSTNADPQKIFAIVESKINTTLSVKTSVRNAEAGIQTMQYLPVTASMGFSAVRRGEKKSINQVLEEANEMERINNKDQERKELRIQMASKAILAGKNKNLK